MESQLQKESQLPKAGEAVGIKKPVVTQQVPEGNGLLGGAMGASKEMGRLLDRQALSVTKNNKLGTRYNIITGQWEY